VAARGKAPHSPHMGGVVRVGTHHHPTPLQLPCRPNPTSCPSGRPGGWCGRDGRERGGRRSGRRVCDQTPGPAGGRRRQPTDDDGGGGEWRRRTTGDGRRTPLLHLSPDRWSSAGGRREWEVETTRCPQALVFRLGGRCESRWFSRGRPRFSVGKSGTQQKTTGTVGTRRRKWGVPESPDSRGNPTGSWRPGRETVGDHGIPTIAQAVRGWSRRGEW